MLESIQTLLLDPNIVFLLYIVAMIGLFVEATHPGAVFPGIVGALAFIIFLVVAAMLGPNWVGLIFMVLALLLLILDVRASAHGVLTVGAALALIFGTFLFFQNIGHIQPWLVYSVSVAIGAIGLLVLFYLARMRRLAAKNGVEGMVGEQAVVTRGLHPMGRVNYAGENWEAELDHPDSSVDKGVEVQIMGVDGLRLRVRPVQTSYDHGELLPSIQKIQIKQGSQKKGG
jgi:membrane-bound serine protease (ClpP class)